MLEGLPIVKLEAGVTDSALCESDREGEEDDLALVARLAESASRSMICLTPALFPLMLSFLALVLPQHSYLCREYRNPGQGLLCNST